MFSNCNSALKIVQMINTYIMPYNIINPLLALNHSLLHLQVSKHNHCGYFSILKLRKRETD